MAIELVTGHTGAAHVSSADAGALHAGIVGTGRYVLATANRMAATMESANTITIATGDALFDGRHVRITSAESATIDSGAQGMRRNDVVGILYQTDGDVESATIAVYKGTPTSGTPTDPTLPTGNILEGATTAFMPLYRVSLNGINASAPVAMFTIAPSTSGNASGISSLNSTITTVRNDLATTNSRLATTNSNLTTTTNTANGVAARFKYGRVNNTHVDVSIPNSTIWLVMMNDLNDELVYYVYRYGSITKAVLLHGTPSGTSGSRWVVAATGTVSDVFGIYSEGRDSNYAALRLM